MISMLKRKMFLKKYDKQRSGKGKCFNCGKPGHFSKDCKQKPGKLKNKFNMLHIDDKEQEELFKILESNNSSDSLEDDFSSSSNSCYQSVDDSSDSPNVKIGCRDSCCNVIKSVNVLTRSEENESLIIKLINQIGNLELQKEYLDKFKKKLIKDEISKKLKSIVSFEEILERFNKKKSKELTDNDLQREINVVKQEINELKHEFKNIKSDNNNLKQELIMLKIDKILINLITNKVNKMSTKMEMNPVNRLFFLINVLLIIPNSILLINCFLQNGLQKLKLLFPKIIISLLLL